MGILIAMAAFFIISVFFITAKIFTIVMKEPINIADMEINRNKRELVKKGLL